MFVRHVNDLLGFCSVLLVVVMSFKYVWLYRSFYYVLVVMYFPRLHRFLLLVGSPVLPPGFFAIFFFTDFSSFFLPVFFNWFCTAAFDYDYLVLSTYSSVVYGTVFFCWERKVNVFHIG